MKNPHAHEIDKHVGARIKQVRRDRGISQSDLADRLGITFQQVQKYENASNRVSAGKLSMIASILGVKVSDFFPGAGPAPQGGKVSRGVLSIANSIRKISDPDAQELALSVALASVDAVRKAQ